MRDRFHAPQMLTIPGFLWQIRCCSVLAVVYRLSNNRSSFMMPASRIMIVLAQVRMSRSLRHRDGEFG